MNSLKSPKKTYRAGKWKSLWEQTRRGHLHFKTKRKQPQGNVAETRQAWLKLIFIFLPTLKIIRHAKDNVREGANKLKWLWNCKILIYFNYTWLGVAKIIESLNFSKQPNELHIFVVFSRLLLHTFAISSALCINRQGVARAVLQTQLSLIN